MNIDFSNKTYLVTGGASGIGAATVRYLATHGGNAVIADLNREAGEALAADFPQHVRFHPTDVTELDQLIAACDLAAESFGGLDGAVNSAGLGSLGTTTDMPLEEWHKVINIDLHGVFYACRASIPHLRKRGGGSIVNVASLSGVRADHGFAAYNAAKAAVINYTRTLALDHGGDNIRATAVCPGFIETPLTEIPGSIDAVKDAWLNAIALGRGGSAEEVANLIVFLLSPAASYITGTEVVIDGGMGSSNNQPNLPRIFSSM
ncbi:SDR family NAD(P)-dependent oxidoreductase [Litorivivens sp.]|uniref:SDR family NAD(P)-dependent oxidoreductase n=1 Tax=Litorivivens sp. TaxID=2020868 RepID=UPI003565CCC7